MAPPAKASAIQMLPPDDQQREIASEVQAKLPPGEAKVSFYRTITEGATRYGTIYQYGSARRNFVSDVPPHDPDDIVKRVKRWVASLHESQRWGLTP
jgi:hypothetical protein